jgi:3-phosphoglycerate kinase
MKEIVYSQIREFSPSLIVVSHSGRLNIESHHLESIFKELSVLSNIKVVLYNNFPCEVREPTLKYFQREDERDPP